jgi:hypothetical protein
MQLEEATSEVLKIGFPADLQFQELPPIWKTNYL